MEPGRQRLSQRRKAAALTQGPLTEHLAVERSALVFRMPGSSAQQLTELVTESKPDTVQATLARTERTIHALSPGPQPAARPDRAGSDELIRPPDVTRSRVPEQAQTRLPNQPVAIPARPFRLTWFPTAGVLAAVFAGGAASILFATSHHTPVPSDTARIPATMTPASAIPAPESKSSTASPTAELGKPELGKPIGAAVSPGATTALGPQGTQGNHQATIRPQPSASRVTPPAGTRATPAEVYNAWPRAAGLRARDQRWKQFRPKPPPPSGPEPSPTSD
jgi:hypothetical protein